MKINCLCYKFTVGDFNLKERRYENVSSMIFPRTCIEDFPTQFISKEKIKFPVDVPDDYLAELISESIMEECYDVESAGNN